MNIIYLTVSNNQGKTFFSPMPFCLQFLFLFPVPRLPIITAGSVKGDESYNIAVHASPLQVPFQPWVLLLSYALKLANLETKTVANTQMLQ